MNCTRLATTRMKATVCM